MTITATDVTESKIFIVDDIVSDIKNLFRSTDLIPTFFKAKPIFSHYFIMLR